MFLFNSVSSCVNVHLVAQFTYSAYTTHILSCNKWINHRKMYTINMQDNAGPRKTHMFNGSFPGLPRWAGTRKVKPIWILLKQETMSGSGISRAICKSAPRSRQITTSAPHHSVFYRPDALPATQPTASKHWRHVCVIITEIKIAHIVHKKKSKIKLRSYNQ